MNAVGRERVVEAIGLERIDLHGCADMQKQVPRSYRNVAVGQISSIRTNIAKIGSAGRAILSTARVAVVRRTGAANVELSFATKGNRIKSSYLTPRLREFKLTEAFLTFTA